MNNNAPEKNALLILHPGFEEMEAIGSIDLLRRAGVDLTTASVEKDIYVTGKNNVTLHADTTLDDLGEAPLFDALVIPGGPGVQNMKDDIRVHDLIRSHLDAGRLVGAICAAPLVVHKAGYLEGRDFTAHASVRDELPTLNESAPVVYDPPLVTSRGAGTATEFALFLVEQLVSEAKRKEIAESIHWQHEPL